MSSQPEASLPDAGRVGSVVPLAQGTPAWAEPSHSGRRTVATRYGRRDYYQRRLLAISDILGITGSLLVMLLTHGGIRSPDIAWELPTIPAWVVLFKAYALYDRDVKRISHTTIDDLPALFHALLLGCLAMWSYSRLVAAHEFVSSGIFMFGGTALVLIMAGRAFTRAAVSRLLPPERVLVIGNGRSTGTLVTKLHSHPEYRLQPIGMLVTGNRPKEEVRLPILGYLNNVDLTDLLLTERVERVVVCDSDVHEGMLLDVLRACKSVCVKVSLLPATFGAMGPSVEVDDIEGVTVFGINPPVLLRTSALAKRALDVCVASTMLVAAAPILAVLALAIKLESRGPVFFAQERVGRGGRRFRVLKLRTMVRDAESQRAALVAQSKDAGWLLLEHDPRITRVGRVLRQTSLDELPQLWNVLRGEMSLVGPRPLVCEEDRNIDGWARTRLDLTPGITGLWQVLGRTSIPFEEMVKLDYLYVTNWSLWGDIRLILRTLPAVIGRNGAN